MDPVTQAALGSAWAQPAARAGRVAAATAAGAVAGAAPDIDMLIRSSHDPLLALEYHRHFTHALSFIPFGALITAALVFPFVRSRLAFGHAYACCFLGYASHGLLDACTSYGTLLLWPFSDRRIAWDLVSVVDPLFTLPLIALVGFGLWRRRPGFALAGLAWCLVYLGAAALQNQRATEAARSLAASRGHLPAAVEVKPSFANIVVWKAIYEHDGRYYVDAVRVGFAPRIFAGESREKLDLARHFPWLERGTQQFADVERFGRFADGYLAVDRDHPNRIVDMRYSLVPNRGDGLWGIELAADAPRDAHAAYVTMRIRSTEEGRELLRMIFQGDSAE